ncbi:ATP-binding protein (plasmid) [Novosphingobium resinovorum]|uniref:PAS domain-containing sensor histidine kinase n=1 Tax=Novosphingobium TaxID=165696 RepID=UPI001B3C7BA2|nr:MULTISPECIES: ATP-binding protein [Novosphingobium]MBF7015672.1 PAS domain S-box protein [Novosphingobium sp. HR1a]WJM30346.1 ATP-binding protein [Novosphingobium resinovorum]
MARDRDASDLSVDRPTDDALSAARALADPIPHLLVWVDLEGRIRFLNRHYTELTGQDRDEAVIHQTWRDKVHPDDLEGLSAALSMGQPGDAGVQFEFRLRHADSSYRWMLLSARAGEETAKGGLWQAEATDIQGRLSAEEELQDLQRTFQDRLARQTAELVRTEARYSSLFSVSKIAFAEQEMADAAVILHRLKQQGVTDLAVYMAEHPEVLQECVAAVRTVSVNEACMRMLGFDDVDGAVDRPVDSTAEDIEAVLLRQFEMIFYGLENVEGRVMLIGAAGRRVPVFYSVTRLADERQLSSLVDISSQERIEEMRLAAQEELARANRVATVGAFSASIAHELNQPVASVSIDANTGLRLLRRDAPDIAAAIRVLERMSSTTQRIATIVKHTHDQITSGHQLVERVDLVELVGRTCDLLARDMRSVGIRLRNECKGEIPAVMGNFVDLQQVVINLINNARDSMTVAGTGKEVIVGLRVIGSEVELSVSDLGTGIPETDIDRLFEPFFTTKEGGIGLGLQICLSTIHRLGGSMHAANRPERGAVFSFKLPVAVS